MKRNKEHPEVVTPYELETGGFNVGMENTPAAAEPEVRRQLNLLKNNVARVHEEITELQGRLEPIMSGERPSVGEAASPDSLEPSTEIGGEVAESAAKVGRAAERIAELRARLEI